MQKKFAARVAVAAASLIFSVSAQAQQVTNGGFETGSFSGWSQTGNTGFNGVQCPGPGVTVRAGNCSAFFGPVGSVGGISQTLTTTPGQEYAILFSLLTDGGVPGSFSVVFGGNTLLSLTNPAATPSYTDYTVFGVAAGGSTALAFNFRDDPGFLFLDAVSITPVPEASTWALMLLGFGAIGAAMRRSQKSRQPAPQLA